MKLKPCPFCARIPEMFEFSVGFKNSKNLYSIVCKCGCESPKDSISKNGAARIWNKRRLENKNK